jgi:hypothetical protein
MPAPSMLASSVSWYADSVDRCIHCICCVPGGWFPDTHCPSQGYSGPYAMPVVSAKWGGTNNNAGTCASNYPRAAPQHNCAHVSFVELVSGRQNFSGRNNSVKLVGLFASAAHTQKQHLHHCNQRSRLRMFLYWCSSIDSALVPVHVHCCRDVDGVACDICCASVWQGCMGRSMHSCLHRMHTVCCTRTAAVPAGAVAPLHTLATL